MKKIVGYVVILIIAVAGASFFILGRRADAPDARQSQSSVQPETKEESTNEQQVALTAAEVAKHNSPSDCWTIISDFVYDVTEFIPRHPGGNEITRACGIDATSLFTHRHTNEGEAVGSGTPHSSSAQSQLEEFKLGELKN